jgi:hypothetical protein
MVAIQKGNTNESAIISSSTRNSSSCNGTVFKKIVDGGFGWIQILLSGVLLLLVVSHHTAIISSSSSSCAAAAATTTRKEPNVVHKPMIQVPTMMGDDSSSSVVVRRKMGLKALKDRDEIGFLLEEMGFEVGVEVGVQKAENAKQLLRRWKSCKEFHLVDLWAHQENYVDGANVDQTRQDSFFDTAQDNLKDHKDKMTFHRMYSTEAATLFTKANITFDFAYIDARHDYCGVTEDLDAYWPLLRPGGVMAGHDFITNGENLKRQQKDDWGLCMDGTRNEGAVRGAVEDFAMKHGLTISVMYAEKCEREQDYIWHSWMLQKPWYFHDN